MTTPAVISGKNATQAAVEFRVGVRIHESMRATVSSRITPDTFRAFAFDYGLHLLFRHTLFMGSFVLTKLSPLKTDFNLKLVRLSMCYYFLCSISMLDNHCIPWKKIDLSVFSEKAIRPGYAVRYL